MTDLRPVVNGDDNSWGTKLLTFLGVHANTDGTLKSSAVQSALGGFLSSLDGLSYGIVAGVIRNDGSPNYWQNLVDGTGHHPLNVDSITTDTSAITLNYSSLGFTKVVSFVAVTDETLSKYGIQLGASVSNTAAVISLSQIRTLNAYITSNGTSFSVSGQNTSPTGNFGVSFSGGVLLVTHDSVGNSNAHAVSLTGRGGNYVPQVAASSGPTATQVGVEFYDYTGAKISTQDANMKVYIQRFMDATVNPQAVDTTAYPSSNIWYFGVFER